MEQAFVYAFIFTIALGMLLSVLLWVYQNKTNRANRYLAGFLCCNALFGFLHYAIAYSGSPALIAAFYGHTSVLFYLIGPMAFWYVRSVLTNQSRLGRTDLWHLVPAILQVANILPFTLMVPWAQRLEIGRQIVADYNAVLGFQHHFYIPVAVNFIARPLLMLVYGLAAWRLWRRHRAALAQQVYGPQYTTTCRWLVLFISLVCILAASYLFFNTGFAGRWSGDAFQVAVMAQVISVVAFQLLYLSLLLFPAILYGMPVFARQQELAVPEATPAIKVPESETPVPVSTQIAKTAEAPLDDSGLSQLTSRIEAYMQAGRPWLEPQFSLANMAAALELPQHHLSWYFNHYLGMSFPAFRNHYRVHYACTLLRQGKAAELNLDAIGQLAGYPARSTFFRAFKEVMHCSPTEYLQQHLSNPAGAAVLQTSLLEMVELRKCG